MKNWTGERLETYIFTRDTIEHLHRYAIVTDYIVDKVVLDIASGEGYGSKLMSEKASFVFGVDIDSNTIENSRLKYQKENLEFRVGSTSEIPIDSNSIDVVVSFETLEHHDQHDKMMLEIKRVLKPHGLLIISTPDKLFYSDMRNFRNEFHIKELYKNDFLKLMEENFKEVQLLKQKYCSGISIIENEIQESEIEIFTGNYTNIEKQSIDPLYLIAIASNIDFERKKDSIFDGGEIKEREIKERAANEEEIVRMVKNSNSYKLGHFLLLPFKILKRRFL